MTLELFSACAVTPDLCGSPGSLALLKCLGRNCMALETCCVLFGPEAQVFLTLLWSVSVHCLFPSVPGRGSEHLMRNSLGIGSAY